MRISGEMVVNLLRRSMVSVFVPELTPVSPVPDAGHGGDVHRTLRSVARIAAGLVHDSGHGLWVDVAPLTWPVSSGFRLP